MLSKVQQLCNRYTRLVFVALLLSQAAHFGCRGKPATDAGPSSDPVRRVFSLLPNQTSAGRLVSGEIHAYTISLSPHQYLRFVTHSSAAPLIVRLMGPRGEALAQHTARCYGMLPISFLPQISGQFTIEVQAARAQEDVTTYELFTEPLREAGPQDDSRLIADEAFAAAEGLRQQWQRQALADALGQYVKALQYWQALNDEADGAAALLGIADLHYLRGKNREALDYYTQALAPSRSSRRLGSEIAALNGMAITCIEMGKIADALQYCTRALDLSRHAGDRRGAALALNHTGLIYYSSGDLLKAIGYFEQALTTSQSDADIGSQALALIDLGYAYQDLGDLSKASDYYSQALAFWRRIDDRRQTALALTAIGNVYMFLGERQEALKRQTEAAAILQQIDDQNGEAAALNGLGSLYDELGERPKALSAYERSLQLCRASGNRAFECQTLGYVGRMYHASGDNRGALACFKRKLQLSRQISNRRIEAHTLRDIGSLLYSQGRLRDALQHYRQALALSRRVNDPRGQAYTLDYIGYIHDTSARKRQALAYYSQALPLIRAVEDRSGEALTLYNIARVNRDLGHLGEARRAIEEVLEKVESLRTKVTDQELRTSYFASVHRYYELCIDVLMRLHRQDPLRGLDAVALEVSEKARARALLDSLAEAGADIRQGVKPELLEKERTLRQALNARVELRVRILSDHHTPEQVERLDQEINKLTDEFKMAQAQIRESSPGYAALTQPSPLSVSEIQRRVLDPGTVLLEYALGDQTSYLWAITPNSIESHRLPGRKVIEELAKKTYELITTQQPLSGETAEEYRQCIAASTAQYWSLASRLSQILLAPVATQISQKRLVIVAEGALQHIAFASLPVPKTDGAWPPAADEDWRVTPLVVEHEIVSLPSASTLDVLRQELSKREPGGKMIAIFADPVFTPEDPRISPPGNAGPPSARAELPPQISRALRDTGGTEEGFYLPRLPGTRAEAAALVEAAAGAEVLLAMDFDANLSRLQSPDLAGCRIVHLATHGILNNQHPELSGIILSLVDRQGHACEGFLTLAAVYNLQLKADLVVLSACNTGLGKDIQGEGLIGLTRGFMYAGARRVVASLWRVNDTATSRLMSLFYKGMLKDGLQPTAALRAAQIEMWEKDRWKSPFFWAAFQIQGEWQPDAWHW
ncbi:MAG TPA: CHAT domain-containing protein [Blastocatellia bacterium]|nr:CHAT domain-containing protein [Blastocatellia bacterium]